MPGTIDARTLFDASGHYHVETIPDQPRDESAHARRVVGSVAVHQDVNVGLDIGEHAPHHVALTLVGLAPHHGTGGTGDLDGAVGGIVVVDVDRRRRQLGAEIGDYLGDCRLFVEAGHQHGQALAAAGPPFLRAPRDHLALRHQFARIDHRSCGGSEVRITLAASPKCGLLNQSHTRSISCECPYDSEARKRACRTMVRTSESGHSRKCAIWRTCRATIAFLCSRVFRSEHSAWPSSSPSKAVRPAPSTVCSSSWPPIWGVSMRPSWRARDRR